MTDAPAIRLYYSGRIINGRCRCYGPTDTGETAVLPARFGTKRWCSWGSDNDGTRGTAVAILQHYLHNLGRGLCTARNWDPYLRFLARTHGGKFCQQVLVRCPVQWNLYLPAIEEFLILAAEERTYGNADWACFESSLGGRGWLVAVPLEGAGRER